MLLRTDLSLGESGPTPQQQSQQLGSENGGGCALEPLGGQEPAGKAPLLTPHQDVCFDLQGLLVLGDDAFPDATVLEAHTGHGDLDPSANSAPWVLEFH